MSLSAAQKANADRLSQALVVFYEHHRRASSLQISLLMAIAAKPGITAMELGEQLNLKPGTLSRALGLLGDKGYKSVPPMLLIKSTPLPSNLRMSQYELTDAGASIVRRAVSS